MAREVVFMFELHQPVRLKPYNALCLSECLTRSIDAMYDWQLNAEVFRRASSKCYLPALKVLLEHLRRGDFKISLSISGSWMEQASNYCGEVLNLLEEVVNTGNAELVAQTHYHSVSPFLSDLEELKEQVDESRKAARELFGFEPKAAEATEFIYNNDIGSLFWNMGFKACVTEGVDRVLAWRSPNYVYSAYGCDLRLLLRNYRLSDDVAFRFSNKMWDQHPLTACKYADWISWSGGDVVFVAMDFETFGEHHWPETGILDFLRWLPKELKARGVEALTISEAAARHRPVDVYDVPPWSTISWADVEKDLSAWAGSDLQVKALELYEELGMYARAVGGPYLKHWRNLGISDNFYYMSSKRGPSGEVHLYFSPFKRALDAYTSYLSLLMILYKEVVEEYLRGVDGYAWKVKTTAKHSFKFTRNGRVVYQARGLNDALKALTSIDGDVAEAHIANGYLQRWIKEVLLWEDLAESINGEVKGSSGSCLKAAVKVLEDARLRRAAANR